MKRKYAAMVLGLTLALTSMNVAYAATEYKNCYRGSRRYNRR